MPSKTEIMQPIFDGLACEVFEHQQYGLFDVTSMRRAARNGRYGAPWSTALTPEHVRWFMTYRDYEPQRVWDLLMDPKAPWLNDPALSLYDNNGFDTFVDGTHRIIARWALRLPDFEFYRVPFDKAIRPRGDTSMARFDWGTRDVTPNGLVPKEEKRT